MLRSWAHGYLSCPFPPQGPLEPGRETQGVIHPPSTQQTPGLMWPGALVHTAETRSAGLHFL